MSKIAYVFPGQGSQSVGMLKELAARFSIVESLFTAASERLGYNLWHLVQQGPESILNQTEHTQVAMLVADVAVYRIIQQQGGPKPAMMAGHSLGEYAALVCADALDVEDAAALVATRGRLMQASAPLGQGAMAAIVGLTDEQVQALCTEASDANEQVTPANYNAIGQVVIAGHTGAVNAAIAIAEKMDARMAKLIPVSVPCHCPLLLKAADAFAQSLYDAHFKIPAVDVISNVDLSTYKTVDQIQSLLKEQLYSPVRWVETIQLMKHKGVETIVECGPGKTLSGLVKRIDKTVTALSVNDPDSLDTVLAQLNHEG